jgi:excisionase family DNA binding protein
MKTRRDIYTTGQVAEMLKVAPRTISKWCDQGRLGCYRIPGSHDRRITHQAFEKFVREEGLPTEYIPPPQTIITAVTTDERLIESCRIVLDYPHYQLRVAADLFSAGYVCSYPTSVVVVDAGLVGMSGAARILGSVTAKTVAIAEPDHDLNEFKPLVVDRVFQRTLDYAAIQSALHSMVNP